MIDYHNEIEPLLAGRWDEILAAYGLEVGTFKGQNTKNMPCPLCGGSDRAHWRLSNGRISLFCRSCAADKMKSAENVLLEITGLGFYELVTELADFVGHVSDNAPVPKKIVNYHDPVKATAFLRKCTTARNVSAFTRFNTQYPHELPVFNGYPIFEITIDNGLLVNLACMAKDGGITFINGGMSLGAWHEIQGCKVRNTGLVVYMSDVIDAIRHHWKFGDTVRCVFDKRELYKIAKKHDLTQCKTGLFYGNTELTKVIKKLI